MKENAIKFLYALDCYLLYLLSGVISAAGVVAYYSISTAVSYGNIGEITDGSAFVDYIADFVSGKSSVVLLVSYCIIIAALILAFAIKRKNLKAYAGLSYARFLSVFGAAVLGVILNIIACSLVPAEASGETEVNAVLILCVLLSPFVEELMFRGVLLKMFGSACGIVLASIITSALFAVSHTDPVQMLYTFLLGLILCIVRVKSTSLWSSFALHMAFNITGAIMLITAPQFTQKGLFELFAGAVLALILACTGGRRIKA